MRQLFAGTVLALTLCFCSNASKNQRREIFPLHPFHSLVDFEDDGGNFTSRSIVDYYVVYGDVSDTASLKTDLLQFAPMRFDTSRIKQPVSYEMRFYKKSERTDTAFRETSKDLIDYHVADYIATVTYNEGREPSILFVK